MYKYNCEAIMKIVLLLSTYLCCYHQVSAVNENDITYYYSSRNNGNDIVVLNRTSVELKNLTRSNEIVFIIHGWNETWKSPNYDEIKDAFLSKSDGIYDVIQVDWSGPATEPYADSVASVSIIAKFIGDFIVDISEKKSIPFDRFHIVGHSLGGQLAGGVGKWVVERTSLQLGKITALDPAGPFFSIPLILYENLSKRDARVVVVIHTDGGVFGYMSSCGTTDLYPNGGSGLQPGCPEYDTQPPDILYCSHHRSKLFFIEILTRKAVYATQCLSYFFYVFGWCGSNKKIDITANITINEQGNYYFTTNGKAPYLKLG